MTSLLRIIKRIAGMPDYDGYLAHHRLEHPEDPPLTEREFCDRYTEARYGGAASRCC